jgi:hypothetical protein
MSWPGCADPDLDASLAAHGTVGKLSDYLWERVRPTPADIGHVADFCLAAVTAQQARPGDRDLGTGSGPAP